MLAQTSIRVLISHIVFSLFLSGHWHRCSSCWALGPLCLVTLPLATGPVLVYRSGGGDYRSLGNYNSSHWTPKTLMNFYLSSLSLPRVSICCLLYPSWFPRWQKITLHVNILPDVYRNFSNTCWVNPVNSELASDLRYSVMSRSHWNPSGHHATVRNKLQKKRDLWITRTQKKKWTRILYAVGVAWRTRSTQPQALETPQS